MTLQGCGKLPQVLERLLQGSGNWGCGNLRQDTARLQQGCNQVAARLQQVSASCQKVGASCHKVAGRFVKVATMFAERLQKIAARLRQFATKVAIRLRQIATRSQQVTGKVAATCDKLQQGWVKVAIKFRQGSSNNSENKILDFFEQCDSRKTVKNLSTQSWSKLLRHFLIELQLWPWKIIHWQFPPSPSYQCRFNHKKRPVQSANRQVNAVWEEREGEAFAQSALVFIQESGEICAHFAFFFSTSFVCDFSLN